MRVIRNIPDQLVISHSPWGMALILGGFAAVFLKGGVEMFTRGDPTWPITIPALLLCLLFFWVLVRPVRVIFDRPSRSVEIIKTSLFGRRRVTHGLDEISRARLGSKRTANGGRQSAINLEIKEGESAGYHPISEYRGGPNHGEITDIINAWLRAAR